MGLLSMKRIGNIYNKLCDLDKIINVYKKIKSNTKIKTKLEKFEDYYCINLVNIYNTLKNHNYEIDKYNLFIIYEPKERLILSLNLKDKIINHMVAYLLFDILEKSLIDSNVAVRVNKGTSYGIKLIKKYINCYKDYYVLKCDIKKYFYSINHKKLKDLLSKKIKDKLFLNIVYKIIDSTNEEYIFEYASKHNIDYLRQGYGLSIGNMTSQILGIFYLNDLDHYIKENLKIKHYTRYMDDLVLFHSNKLYLKECLKKIIKFLNNYDLELNNKTVILKNNLCFLGYHFYNKKIKILSKNKRIIYKKLRILKQYNLEKYNKVLSSYYGYFKIQKY